MINSKNPFFKFLSHEDIEHIKVVEFLKSNFPDVIAFHVPNSSKKSAFDRYKHSIMGVLKGISDFVILHPKYLTKIEESKSKTMLAYHSLVIELKAPEHNVIVKKGKDIGKIKKTKGVLSPEQKIILDKLNNLKFQAVCCFGAEEAISVIKKYMSVN